MGDTNWLCLHIHRIFRHNNHQKSEILEIGRVHKCDLDSHLRSHVSFLVVMFNRTYCLTNSRNIWLVHETPRCLLILSTRLLSCFLLDYWLSLQSLSFLLVSLICGCNFVHKIMPSPQRAEAIMRLFHERCLNNDDFKSYIKRHVREAIIPEDEL